MKVLKAIFWPLCLFLVLSCSDDDSNNTIKNGVIDAASNGTWRITYFYDSDVDKSSTFTDYIFAFRSADVVTADKTSADQIMGLWRISDSNDKADTLDDLRFNLTFGAPPEFELLSNAWTITEYSLTKIKLTDVNGAGGNDYLTLEKN